jgi:hypothetical protein
MGFPRAVLSLLASAALLSAAGVQPKPVHRWKDEKGKVQITNTPPPPGAEVLDGPPPPLAVETEHAGSRLLVRQSLGTAKRHPADLTATQREAWEALDKHLDEARKRGDTKVLEAVASSLLSDSLWGNGLGWVALIPFLTLAVCALLGWWLAFGLRSSQRLPVIASFSAFGLLAAQLLVGHFLYRPQSFRVKVNMSLFTEHYLGGDKQLTPQQRERLAKHFAALEDATGPFNLPWSFYSEVDDLETTLKQVVTSK